MLGGDAERWMLKVKPWWWLVLAALWLPLVVDRIYFHPAGWFRTAISVVVCLGWVFIYFREKARQSKV